MSSSSDATKYTSKLYATRILIIGGSSGIGYAVAEACLEFGARVAISSSNPERVNAAVEKLQSSYPSKKGDVCGVVVDLGKAETLESELENVLKSSAQKLNDGNDGAKLDHVVFTAGDALATIKLADMTYQNIVAAGQVRFFAPLLLAKFLPRYLEGSYRSSYTITTGMIAESTIPDWSVIASYAGGHHSMVRNLALDLRPIRVSPHSCTIVYPSYPPTPSTPSPISTPCKTTLTIKFFANARKGQRHRSRRRRDAAVAPEP
jgi:NAD(P)-dependent dehydrogenase (short-subunit alcohol dehydrogenase family)